MTDDPPIDDRNDDAADLRARLDAADAADESESADDADALTAEQIAHIDAIIADADGKALRRAARACADERERESVDPSPGLSPAQVHYFDVLTFGPVGSQDPAAGHDPHARLTDDGRDRDREGRR
jgi:hypothetical protein